MEEEHHLVTQSDVLTEQAIAQLLLKYEDSLLWRSFYEDMVYYCYLCRIGLANTCFHHLYSGGKINYTISVYMHVWTCTSVHACVHACK